MIKGIIFDLDGVIISTDKLHYASWKKIADDEGIPFDEKINNRLRGISRMDSLDIVLGKADKEYSKGEKEALCEKKNDIYRRYLESLEPTDVDKEVLLALKALREKGIKLALGSGSRNATFILKKIGLKDFFDAVVDGNMITHSKPNPEVFLLAADKLNLKPADCAVVEDAKSGVEAAKAGGFVSFGISDASDSDYCDHPIAKLSDLLKYLNDKPRLED